MAITDVPVGVSTRDVLRERTHANGQTLGMFGAQPTTTIDGAGAPVVVGNPWRNVASPFAPGGAIAEIPLGQWMGAVEEVIPWEVTLHPLRAFNGGAFVTPVTDVACVISYGAGGVVLEVAVDWPVMGGAFLVPASSLSLKMRGFNATALAPASLLDTAPVGSAHLAPAHGPPAAQHYIGPTRTVPYSAAPGGGIVDIPIPAMAAAYYYRPSSFAGGQFSVQQRNASGIAQALDLYLVSTSLGTAAQFAQPYRLNPRASQLRLTNSDAVITNAGAIIFVLAL